MRGHVQGSRGSHEVLRVVGLVRAHGDAPRTALLLVGQHQQRRLALGVAIGLGGHRGGDQTIAILHQGVAQIGQFGLLAVALLVQPRVRVGGRFVRLVGALAVVEVGTVAVRSVLLAEALLRRPGLDQRAVDGEVLVAHEPLCLLVHGREKLLRDLARQQPVAVLREHGMVPNRVVHAQAHEPAKEQVVVDLLD